MKKSIILPVKLIYAKRILDGTKKYEFRKKLCKRDIEKIYLYVTAPVQEVIGFVYVTGKIQDTVPGLWDITKKYSGIEYEKFVTYFSQCSVACAYKLGEGTVFTTPKKLSEFGINCVPQAYVYVE